VPSLKTKENKKQLGRRRTGPLGQLVIPSYTLQRELEMVRRNQDSETHSKDDSRIREKRGHEIKIKKTLDIFYPVLRGEEDQ